ncbi:MAG: TonB-dependent receptor domain-containing protein [Comamonas sp.]
MSPIFLPPRARAALRLSAISVAALALCSPALAQDGGAPLSEMVVTANRTAQPLSDLVADMSIVDRETIERAGPSGVADVLSRLPGIEMVRNGGPGATTSLYLRGADTRFTAVYIDGVRIDSQSTGGASWQAIPLSVIDRIEVLRGPAAAVYGSDAMGGVVQIFTKKGEGAPQPYVGMGLGNRGTFTAEAGVSGGADGWDYAIGLARAQSHGFNARTVATANPDDDGYRNNAVFGRLGYQINRQHRVEATLLSSYMNSGYDASKPPVDDRSISKLQTLGLNWQAQWTSEYSTKLQYTQSRDEYETRPSLYLTDTRLQNYLFQNEYRRGIHTLTAALERREDKLENGDIDRKRFQNALALGWGLRSGAHTAQFNLRHDRDSEFGGKTTGSASYGYEFMPHWRATVSAGTAFRAPTLYQRFSMYGDPSLTPEQGRNAELGLRWADGHDSFSATVYRNRVRNLINWVGGTGTCAGNEGPFGGCYASVGRAVYEGVTLAGGTRVGMVNLRASVDFQNPHDLDTGKMLARRAKRRATLSADTTLAGWTLGGELQANGQRYDDAANTKVLGGYTLLNLTASTQLGKDFSLVARLNNLADKKYELARTYATEGRSVYVGVRWAPR